MLLFESVEYWGYVLLTILLSLRPFGARKQFSLLYGVGIDDLLAKGSDGRFLGFCRDGQLPPLVAFRHLAVQALQTIHSTDPVRVR